MGSGNMLMRLLPAMAVLGLCGLGLAEGLSSAGVMGEESRPMLCLLAVGRLGGVLSLTFTQSVESTEGDNGDLLGPTELRAPAESRGRWEIVAGAEGAGDERPSGLGRGRPELD